MPQITIGFTGTSKGLTESQLSELKNVLFEHPYDRIVFRHGDCIGADEQAHQAAREAGCAMIVIHPPSNPEFRAFCTGDEWEEEKPYLERNHDIVDNSDILIACPGEHNEVMRSGTWATIRYARSMETDQIVILKPSGKGE